MTGAQKIICKPYRAEGFEWEDFDDCLDAPAYVATGSVQGFDLGTYGTKRNSTVAFNLRPGAF